MKRLHDLTCYDCTLGKVSTHLHVRSRSRDIFLIRARLSSYVARMSNNMEQALTNSYIHVEHTFSLNCGVSSFYRHEDRLQTYMKDLCVCVCVCVCVATGHIATGPYSVAVTRSCPLSFTLHMCVSLGH